MCCLSATSRTKARNPRDSRRFVRHVSAALIRSAGQVRANVLCAARGAPHSVQKSDVLYRPPREIAEKTSPALTRRGTKRGFVLSSFVRSAVESRVEGQESRTEPWIRPRLTATRSWQQVGLLSDSGAGPTVGQAPPDVDVGRALRQAQRGGGAVSGGA